MSPYLNLDLRIAAPRHPGLDKFLNRMGYEIGKAIHNGGWGRMTWSDEKLLRLVGPPVTDGRTMRIDMAEYDWKDLQSHRQFQSNTLNDSDSLSYILNTVVLTANAVIHTSDQKLVFHYKKGGAAYGSIHSFGGYVHKKDIDKGGLEHALIRELSEPDELGLEPGRLNVAGLFGTAQGMPSILWDWGTAAVYGLVKADYSSGDLTKRLQEIPARETAGQGLYIIEPDQLHRLSQASNLHPQTRKILPVLESIYTRQYSFSPAEHEEPQVIYND